MRMKTILFAFLVALVACAVPAKAAPVTIGTFNWVADPFFGDYFSITNDLDPSDPLASLQWLPTVVLALNPSADPGVLDGVDPDRDGLATLDLFPLTNPTTVGPNDVATTFSDFYSDYVLSATLSFGNLTGFSVSGPLGIAGGDPAEITYDSQVAPVPEPGTLLLVGGGLAAAACRRRRARR
jgi:hypothetical protein